MKGTEEISMRPMRAVEMPSCARKRGWKLCGMVSPNWTMKVAPQMPRKTSRLLLSMKFAWETDYDRRRGVPD